MKYNYNVGKNESPRASGISNVELMLLELICEQGETSGYKIDQLVKDRGCRIWAGIGTTSIYMGLEKLRKKHFVEFYIDTEKQGKGPSPKKFRITKEGENILKREVAETLASRLLKNVVASFMRPNKLGDYRYLTQHIAVQT
jgi:DNA-binding PadR family transcriptional regulator